MFYCCFSACVLRRTEAEERAVGFGSFFFLPPVMVLGFLDGIGLLSCVRGGGAKCILYSSLRSGNVYHSLEGRKVWREGRRCRLEAVRSVRVGDGLGDEDGGSPVSEVRTTPKASVSSPSMDKAKLAEFYKKLQRRIITGI